MVEIISRGFESHPVHQLTYKFTIMPNNYDHIHYATDERLAQLLREIARRHVDDDRETIYEAARRLEAYRHRAETFNDEAFSV